jgi:hypothetical protein
VIAYLKLSTYSDICNYNQLILRALSLEDKTVAVFRKFSERTIYLNGKQTCELESPTFYAGEIVTLSPSFDLNFSAALFWFKAISRKP